MPARKILFIVCLILLVTSIGFGWWYAGMVSSERQAQQQEALASGIEAFKAKNYSVALTELRQVPSDHQEGWKARYYEGFSQIMVKDYAAAVLLLEEALELNPEGTDIMHALGVAYFKLGNLSMSKAYFAQVLEINPDDEEARGLMDIMSKLERQQPGQVSDPEG